MVADLSAITYFEPILAFLVVFVVTFAVLAKTKLLGESQFVNVFVSFLIATIFVSAAGARDYVISVTPWFAILLVSLFFIFVLVGLTGDIEWMSKGAGIAALVLLGIVFLVSGYLIFSSYLNNPDIVKFFDFISSSRISGAIALLIVGAIASWVLVKAK